MRKCRHCYAAFFKNKGRNSCKIMHDQSYYVQNNSMVHNFQMPAWKKDWNKLQSFHSASDCRRLIGLSTIEESKGEIPKMLQNLGQCPV